MKTQKITANNLERLKDLDLHDSKLTEIICNYDTHEVNIPLKLDYLNKKNVFVSLKFSNVKKFFVEILEPWGAGIYIHEIKVKSQNLEGDSHFFELTILLNSGDRICIISNEINYYEE